MARRIGAVSGLCLSRLPLWGVWLVQCERAPPALRRGATPAGLSPVIVAPELPDLVSARRASPSFRSDQPQGDRGVQAETDENFFDGRDPGRETTGKGSRSPRAWSLGGL